MSSPQTLAHKHWANPSVLQWARKQSVLDIEEVASSLNISTEILKAWEEGVKRPDTDSLRKLSNLYDYPFSYFFLEKLPEESQLKDFRGTPEDKRAAFSRDTKLSLREFRRLTRLAAMLQQITGDYFHTKIGEAQKDEDPEEVAKREVQRLGISEDVVGTSFAREKAYNAWREAIEALGIFVFSLRMSPKECRGAAIVEQPYVTAILINQNDAVVARSFTLLHEYCHLLLRSKRELIVCDQYPSNAESFANRFAASALVPKDRFIKVLQDREENHYHDWWTDVLLQDLARTFNVSRDVIAIRLENLNFAPSGFYAEKRKLWYKSIQRPGFGQAKKKRVHAREKIGSRLFNMTLGAVKTGLIHPVDAALYMGRVAGGKDRPWFVKAKDIERWVEEKAHE